MSYIGHAYGPWLRRQKEINSLEEKRERAKTKASKLVKMIANGEITNFDTVIKIAKDIARNLDV